MIFLLTVIILPLAVTIYLFFYNSKENNVFLKHNLSDIEFYGQRFKSLDKSDDSAVQYGKLLLKTYDKYETEKQHNSILLNVTQKIRLFALLSVIPIITWASYYYLGSPYQPDKSWQAKIDLEKLQDLPLIELVSFLEVVATKNPNDGKLLDVIAPLYLELGDADMAAEYFTRSISVNGKSSRRLNGLAKAVLLANGGVITEDSYNLFLEAAKFDANDDISRYYIEKYKQQEK